jgi:hypothetical protein
MTTNLTFEYHNYISYVCGPDDFTDIKDIFNSRKTVNGCLKNEQFYKNFEEFFPKILSREIDEKLIIGVRNKVSNQLLSYSIISLPKESCFMFLHFGETYKSPNRVFGEDRAPYGIFKLSTIIGESNGRFDFFWSTRIRNFFPEINLIKRQSVFEKEPARYIYSINSVVQKNQAPSNPIQKYLIRSDTIDRDFDAVIIHGSLKPEYRLPYFETYLGARKTY